MRLAARCTRPTVRASEAGALGSRGRAGIVGSPTPGSWPLSRSSIGGYLVYRGRRRRGGWWLVRHRSGVFVALVVSHEPISRAGDRARRAVDFYAKGLARLDGRWAGTGVAGLDYLDVDHPYAADLDLFGRGSLFERLCTARTRAGEEVLASWLLAPATTGGDRRTARGGRRAASPARPARGPRAAGGRGPRRGSTRPPWPPGAPARARFTAAPCPSSRPSWRVLGDGRPCRLALLRVRGCFLAGRS